MDKDKEKIISAINIEASRRICQDPVSKAVYEMYSIGDTRDFLLNILMSRTKICPECHGPFLIELPAGYEIWSNTDEKKSRTVKIVSGDGWCLECFAIIPPYRDANKEAVKTKREICALLKLI